MQAFVVGFRYKFSVSMVHWIISWLFSLIWFSLCFGETHFERQSNFKEKKFLKFEVRRCVSSSELDTHANWSTTNASSDNFLQQKSSFSLFYVSRRRQCHCHITQKSLLCKIWFWLFVIWKKKLNFCSHSKVTCHM